MSTDSDLIECRKLLGIMREMLRVSVDAVSLAKDIGMTFDDFKALEIQCALNVTKTRNRKRSTQCLTPY